MKRIYFIISTIIIIGYLGSCEKSDNYYKEYSKDNIFYDGTIYEYLVKNPGQYDSLVLLLEMLPELKEKLNDNKENKSFFAINNSSFALAIKNLNTKRLEAGEKPKYIEDLDKLILDTLIYRYVIDSLIGIDNLKRNRDGIVIRSAKYDYEMQGQYRVLTASGLVGKGEQQIVYSDRNNSIYKRYWVNANTKSVNLKANNGYIHTLNAQHEFAFGKLTHYFTKDSI